MFVNAIDICSVFRKLGFQASEVFLNIHDQGDSSQYSKVRSSLIVQKTRCFHDKKLCHQWMNFCISGLWFLMNTKEAPDSHHVGVSENVVYP